MVYKTYDNTIKALGIRLIMVILRQRTLARMVGRWMRYAVHGTVEGLFLKNFSAGRRHQRCSLNQDFGTSGLQLGCEITLSGGVCEGSIAPEIHVTDVAGIAGGRGLVEPREGVGRVEGSEDPTRSVAAAAGNFLEELYN